MWVSLFAIAAALAIGLSAAAIVIQATGHEETPFG